MKGISENLYRLQTLDSTGSSNDRTEAAALRSSIPEGMLANYDRARARGRKGIALLKNNVCANCRIQLPIATAAALMRGTIQACSNCGIYLYLPESHSQAPGPLAAVPSPSPRRKRTNRVAT